MALILTDSGELELLDVLLGDGTAAGDFTMKLFSNDATLSGSNPLPDRS